LGFSNFGVVRAIGKHGKNTKKEKMCVEEGETFAGEDRGDESAESEAREEGAIEIEPKRKKAEDNDGGDGGGERS
jgi:hypothetical protein